MAKKKDGLANPERLKAVEKHGQVQIVIETPKGSRNKYAFDTEQRTFRLRKVLPEGMSFPHDFGFIPSTRAADGDPLDVLLLMDQPAFPGCVVDARLVGVMEAEQFEDGEKKRNDRLIAVCTASHTHSDVRSIADLNDTLLREIEEFFVNYNSSNGKKFKVLARKGPKAAAKCLKKAQSKRA